MTVMNVVIDYSYRYDANTFRVSFSSADPTYKDVVPPYDYFLTKGPLDVSNYVFPSLQDAIDYFSLPANGPTAVVGTINNTYGTSYTYGQIISYSEAVKDGLDSKFNIPTPATHITDAAINAPVNAATNAPNNATTNYNVVTTLLGTLTSAVNATNTSQNQIADIVNANAVKQNAGFTILNAIGSKFNLSLDILESNGLMAA